jgi:hypothetical protein
MTTPATPCGENPMGSCHRGGTFSLNSEVRLGEPYRAARSTRLSTIVLACPRDFNSFAIDIIVTFSETKHTHYISY